MFNFLRLTKSSRKAPIRRAAWNSVQKRTILRVESLDERIVPSIRTYQETAIASGTLGGATFTNAQIQLVSSADPANVQSAREIGRAHV